MNPKDLLFGRELDDEELEERLAQIQKNNLLDIPQPEHLVSGVSVEIEIELIENMANNLAELSHHMVFDYYRYLRELKQMVFNKGWASKKTKDWGKSYQDLIKGE